MTYSAKKDSRHITLRPDAMAIYDRWKKEGNVIANTSQAIIEYDNKGITLDTLQVQVDDLRMRVEKLEGRGRVSELFTLW